MSRGNTPPGGYTADSPKPRRRWYEQNRRWFLAAIAAALIGYVLLSGFTVLLWVNGKHVSHDAARAAAKAAAAQAIAEGERNARFAEKRAGVQATYQACVRSIPTLINVNRFVNATKGGFEDLLTNAIANHEATPPDNPQYQAQVRNIARLRARVRATQSVQFPIPTRKACQVRRADDLAALAKSEEGEADLPLPKAQQQP